MRLLCRALPLLILATLAAAPAAAQLEGRWTLSRILDRPLPQRSPTEDGVTIKRASLSLDAAGRFEMSITADGSSGETTQRVAGTYAIVFDSIHESNVVRDSVYLTSDGGGAPPVRFQWYRMRDTLTLLDERHYDYRWVREPMPVAGDPWTPGAWTTARLNGRALPAAWPMGRHVTVREWTFAFSLDGRLTGDFTSDISGEFRTQIADYRYRVEGEKLFLLREDGSVDDEFLWTLRDGVLRLVDENGGVYILARP